MERRKRRYHIDVKLDPTNQPTKIAWIIREIKGGEAEKGPADESNHRGECIANMGEGALWRRV